MARLIRKILVPIDRSESALDAAWLASTLAVALPAALTLLHVEERAAIEVFRLNNAKLDSMSRDDFHDLVWKFVEDPYLDTVQRSANLDVIDVKFEKCSSRAAAAICQYAASAGVDLIVMGSRGQSDIRELLSGSVSSDVLHHAPCPVTIVR